MLMQEVSEEYLTAKFLNMLEYIKKMERNELSIPKPKPLRIPYSTEVACMILAVKTFALNDSIMKSFEGNSDVGWPEREIDYCISRARRVSENAFGMGTERDDGEVVDCRWRNDGVMLSFLPIRNVARKTSDHPKECMTIYLKISFWIIYHHGVDKTKPNEGYLKCSVLVTQTFKTQTFSPNHLDSYIPLLPVNYEIFEFVWHCLYLLNIITKKMTTNKCIKNIIAYLKRKSYFFSLVIFHLVFFSVLFFFHRASIIFIFGIIQYTIIFWLLITLRGAVYRLVRGWEWINLSSQSRGKATI